MARYLKHTSCPSCGSSDANALYDNGSAYCFSCNKYTPARISPYVKQEEEDKQKVAYPPDITQEYPPQAMEWFNKYDMHIPTLLKNNVYYSAYRNQVIFGFEDGSGNLLAYQARNLSPENKSKRYYTKGDINGLLNVYDFNSSSLTSLGMGATNYSCSFKRSRTLVLVEDCLSALKVVDALSNRANGEKALGASALPLLGSGISRTKLSRLRPFYDVLKVFLDGDMWHKAVNIARQAQLLGFKAEAVYDDRDPKELSYTQLQEKLK